MQDNPDPRLVNPLLLIGIVIRILRFRPLKGGGVLIMGSTLGSGTCSDVSASQRVQEVLLHA